MSGVCRDIVSTVAVDARNPDAKMIFTLTPFNQHVTGSSIFLMTDESPRHEEVLAQLRDSGEATLAQLFDEHRERLQRMVAFRMDHRLHGRVDPADVVQESYLDAVKRIPHYLDKPVVSVFIWIRSITGQTLINVHRRHVKAQRRAAGREVRRPRGAAPQATSVSLAAYLVGQQTSPSQVAMRAEALAGIEQALEQMDEMDREVLVLRHFEELTNQETAEALGLQKAAASNRYVRALKRLREILVNTPGLSFSS